MVVPVSKVVPVTDPLAAEDLVNLFDQINNQEIRPDHYMMSPGLFSDLMELASGAMDDWEFPAIFP